MCDILPPIDLRQWSVSASLVMTRASPSSNSTVRVVSETSTVTVWCLWIGAQGDLLPDDHDHAGVAGPALDPA